MLLLAALFFISLAAATAATRTWTGGAIANDFWTDKDNWAGNVAPSGGDILVFPDGIQLSDKGTRNSFNAGTVFQELIFRDYSYSVSGGPVLLSGGIIVPDGGSVTFNTGLRLAANQTFAVTNGTIVIDPGAVGDAIDTQGRTLTLRYHDGEIHVRGTIVGSGGVTIEGNTPSGLHRVFFSEANTYAGPTYIRANASLTLQAHPTAFSAYLATPGSSAGPTHVFGELLVLPSLEEGTYTLAEPLKLYPQSSVKVDLNPVDFTGSVELVGPGAMTLETLSSAATVRFLGVISGAGDLHLENRGTNILGGSSANTFAGSCRIARGLTILAKPSGVAALACATIDVSRTGPAPDPVLRLNANEQIADSANVFVGSSGTFDLQGRTETISNLLLAGGTVAGTSAGRLELLGDISSLNVLSSPSLIDVPIRIHANPCVLDVIDGSGVDDLVFNKIILDAPGSSLKKVGAGRVLLRELATFPLELVGGTTVIEQGGASPISLNGGTLAGNGLVGIITSLAGGGRVEPGLSTGIITNNGLAWNPATTFAVELLNATPGSGHDQLKVFLGTVNLGGARLDLTLLPGFSASVNDNFVLIDKDGVAPVAGQFAGLTNGAEIVTASGVKFAIRYDGGTGNDVVLRPTFFPPTGITRTWDGGDLSNDNTTDADNWNLNVLPQPGDALLFPNVAKKTVQNGFPAFTPFDTLTFTAPGYAVNGLPIALLNGLTNSAASGTNVFNLPMRLIQDATIASTAAGKLIVGTIDFEFVNLNSHTLNLHAATADSAIDFGLDFSNLNPQDGIFGSGAVVKTGLGTITIKCFNDYTGPTTVQQGTLTVQNGDALGEVGPGNGTTIATGAVLAFSPIGDYGGDFREDILLNGTLRQLPTGGGFGPPLYSTLTVNHADRVVEVPDGHLDYYGVVQGPGGLRKIGAGDLILHGTNANTFSGRLLVEAGRVTLGKSPGTNAVGGPIEVTGGVLFAEVREQLGATPSLTVRGPGFVDFNDKAQTLNGGLFLQGASVSNCAPLDLHGNLSTIAAAAPSVIEGSMQLTGTSQWTVTDGGADPDLLVAAQIFQFGTATLRKTGGGKVVFTAPNLFSRAQLDAGVALFHGSNSTRIDLNGGTLGGTGTVANLTSLAAGGTVAPGASTGILTASNVVWNPATTFAVEVRTATPGSGHDQLKVRGTIDLGGATLDLTVLSNFTATVADTLVLIDNDGADAVVGTFAGLTNNATFSVAEEGAGTPRTFRIAYNGGTGNDVTLRLLNVGSGITRTWDGGGTNNNWSVNTNWDGNLTAPTAGDALVFPIGAARLLNTNNFAAGTAFDRITIQTTGYTLRGNRVSLNQGMLFENTGNSAVQFPITLAQPQTFAHIAASGTQTVAPQGAGASLDNAGHQLTISVSSGIARLDVSGLTGSGSVVKTGRGGSFFQQNTYTGFTIVQQGAIFLAGADGLGSTAVGTIIGAEGSLFFSSAPAVAIAEPLTLSGLITFSSSPVILTGGILLPDGAQGRITVSGAAPSLRSVISGSGALRKISAGELIIDGTAANTFTGGATVAGGVLRLQKTAGVATLPGPVIIDGTAFAAELRLANNDQILDTATVSLVGTGAVFNLNNQSETVNDLVMTGGSVLTGTGTLTVPGSVNSLASSNTASIDGLVSLEGSATWTVEDGLADSDLVISAVISGKEGTTLTKAGAGRAVFAGNNTVPVLNIDEGEAAITRDSSAMLAQLNGGTLSGGGIIGGITSLAGGIVAPGASPGILTSSSNVVWNEKTTFAVELLNTTPGTGHDQLAVQGAIDLGFAQLDVTLLPGFTPFHGQQFKIIDNLGADRVTGEFAELPDGRELDLGVVRLRVSYAGGDGNDVVLTVSVVNATGVASVWDGGAGAGDPKWTTAANWVGDLAPVQGNALVFPSGPTQRFTVNDFIAGTSFESILFEGGNYNLGGNRVVLNSGLRSDVPNNDPGLTLTLPLKLAQSQTFLINSNGIILNGGIDTDGKTLTLRLEGDAQCIVGTLPISGAGGLTKGGPGLLFLNVNNSYSGATLLQGGRTVVTSAGALGGFAGTMIQAAELELRNDAPMTISEPITLTSTNSLLVTTNSHTLTGTFSLTGAGARELRIGSNATLTVNGRVSGTGGLRKTDIGTLRLGGSLANLFTGGTVLDQGKLELAKTSSNAIPGTLVLGSPGRVTTTTLLSSNQIADTADLSFINGAALFLGDFSDTVGGLIIERGSVSTTTNGLFTLTGGLQCNGVGTFFGRVRVAGGARVWSIADGASDDDLAVFADVSAGPDAWIIKTGSGVMNLFGTNPLPLVQIAAGSVLFTGHSPATSVRLNGGLLGGTGAAGHVTALAPGGFVVPGPGIGVLTTSNLNWNAATVFRCELGELESDHVTALGPVNLGGAVLDLTLGFTPPLNYTVALLLNESGAPITGTFAGLPEGAFFAVNGLVFQLTYQGADADDTDGNDVQITRVAGPPSNLSSIGCLPNGAKQLTLSGVPGAFYTIEATTNLLSPSNLTPWVPLNTSPADGAGLLQFIDPDSLVFPQRFYRVLSP